MYTVVAECIRFQDFDFNAYGIRFQDFDFNVVYGWLLQNVFDFRILISIIMVVAGYLDIFKCDDL